MKAQFCCLVSAAVLLCLFGWLSTTVAAPGRNSTVVSHCPRKLTVVPSSRGCVSDKDCAGEHKCCVFSCGAVCVPPAFTKPGVCPRRTFGAGVCAEYCANDSDCPNNEKCCSNGCGHECTPPYTVKPGRCAQPKGTPMCAEYCYHDGQCPAEQKCCPTTCGHACSEPC
ncbi:WAP four-disulfide core domain protein 2-like [Myxocyprinus asiaticus]|uniref:WAP four-disulfide core domain protein 2-like n=1 Tax=Myxocyprinus asiaticus TaxID=70543 RepID=UPI0022224492|nr:WAP four-disulfide core domain protein 2-like [Myxocyprinus asiaticus]XP_051516509.1 WAP four-disulfide core domain protein 2-like [Myxocyprinus asiaticus]XP_051516510.1 WAP four-disulfide core domain protein 2-like [Myxocyprinus asiaticus]